MRIRHHMFWWSCWLHSNCLDSTVLLLVLESWCRDIVDRLLYEHCLLFDCQVSFAVYYLNSKKKQKLQKWQKRRIAKVATVAKVEFFADAEVAYCFVCLLILWWSWCVSFSWWVSRWNDFQSDPMNGLSSVGVTRYGPWNCSGAATAVVSCRGY